jgi:putative addiction module component (TIGR02574 family)
MVSSSEQNVFDAALELPEKPQAELAERFSESLDGGSKTQSADAWAIELRRRWAAVESGDAHIADGPTAMSEIRLKYGVDKE